MGRYMERAIELRKDPDRHYNCAQAVLIPFAEEKGISGEAAYALAENYASGMKMGSVCGAIAAGLMVLGLYGINDRETISAYYRAFKDAHEGELNCAGLLAKNRAAGGNRKEHCDGLVFETVGILENLIGKGS